MNSTGQAFSSNPLINGTDKFSVTAGGKSSSSSVSGDNTLNNKEFSDVLDKQQAHEKVSAPGRSEHAATDSLKTDTTITEPLDILAVEDAALLELGTSGNPLPAEGFSLPLAANIADPSVTVIDTQAQFSDQALPIAAVELRLQQGSGEAALNPDANKGVTPLADAVDQQDKAMVPLLNPNTNLNKPVAPALSTPVGAELTAASAPAAVQWSVQSGLNQRSGSAAATNNGSILAQPIASAAIDVDTANSLTSSTGANARSTSLAGTGSELAAQFQLQSTLAQAANPALASGPTLTASATESVSPLVNASAMTEAPQAYRATTPSAFQTAVPVEVGKPGWSDTVMQRVMWMSSQQINKAEIALDPPELGPLKVRISTQGDSTAVSFTSNHSLVRDALDQGLPRLREMMDSQGLNLAEVDVSDQRSHQQSQRGDGEGSEALSTDDSVGEQDSVKADSEMATVSSDSMKTLSLVDQYV